MKIMLLLNNNNTTMDIVLKRCWSDYEEWLLNPRISSQINLKSVWKHIASSMMVYSESESANERLINNPDAPLHIDRDTTTDKDDNM